MPWVKWFVFPVFIGVLVFSSGCSKQQQKIIKIASHGTLTARTGLKSPSGLGAVQGAQLAIEQLSGPLSDLGYRVEFIPFDDESKPEKGAANAGVIVADAGILAAVGHQNSGLHIASTEVYHGAQLASISPSATNPKVTDRGYLEVNRICGRDDVQGILGAQFAKSRGVKRVFVLHTKSVYSLGIAEVFRKEAKSLGMEVVGFEGTEETEDFSSVLKPILASRPQLIYWAGTYAAIIKQARARGYMGMFLSVDGFDSPDAARRAGDAILQGEGTYFSTIAGPAFAYSDTAKFITDHKARYGKAPHPSASKSYDCAAMILKAIENAVIKKKDGETPSRKEVAQAIRELKEFPGITGMITLNGNGDLVKTKYFIIQVTSSDPARWVFNRVDRALDIVPPQ